MKINIRKLGFMLLIIATIIPSYWFFSDRKILNLIYYMTTFLFLTQFFLLRSKSVNVKYGTAGIYILSLFLYSLQAFLDSGIATAINTVVSSVVIILIVSRNVKDEIDFNEVIDCLLYISCLLLIFGILEAVSGVNPFQQSVLTLSGATFYSETRLGIYRVSSVFGHPIVYCNYLSIIAALSIYRLSCKLGRKRRRVFWFIYAMTVLNVLLTVSRSVMLVFIAEQIILLALKGERWLTTRKISILLLIIFSALVSDMLGLGILDKVSDIFNMILQVFGLGSDSYSSAFSSIGYTGVTGDRWDLYFWVALSLSGHWLIGQGTNATFSYMVTEYREKTSIENYYLSTLYHHGIIGLIVLIIGLIGILYYLFKQIRRNSKLDKKLLGENKLTFNFVILCILIGEILSYFMVDQSGEVRLLYVCIGLALAYNRLQAVRVYSQ